MQKIRPIHKTIFKIQHILGSHDQAHPKIIEITFSFPEFAPARKKNQFIPSIPSIYYIYSIIGS